MKEGEIAFEDANELEFGGASEGNLALEDGLDDSYDPFGDSFGGSFDDSSGDWLEDALVGGELGDRMVEGDPEDGLEDGLENDGLVGVVGDEFENVIEDAIESESGSFGIARMQQADEGQFVVVASSCAENDEMKGVSWRYTKV